VTPDELVVNEKCPEASLNELVVNEKIDPS
jgi:hypothetical protein